MTNRIQTRSHAVRHPNCTVIQPDPGQILLRNTQRWNHPLSHCMRPQVFLSRWNPHQADCLVLFCSSWKYAPARCWSEDQTRIQIALEQRTSSPLVSVVHILDISCRRNNEVLRNCSKWVPCGLQTSCLNFGPYAWRIYLQRYVVIRHIGFYDDFS
jgi:hypothetical protein